MLAYVRLVQSREKELGADVLTHQKWSGAPYMDGILGAIQSGSSSSKSMGEGNTEKGELFEILFMTAAANTVPRFLKRWLLLMASCMHCRRWAPWLFCVVLYMEVNCKDADFPSDTILYHYTIITRSRYFCNR
jgi:hypothetical protein